jgi:hypothetical protein
MLADMQLAGQASAIRRTQILEPFSRPERCGFGLVYRRWIGQHRRDCDRGFFALPGARTPGHGIMQPGPEPRAVNVDILEVDYYVVV